MSGLRYFSSKAKLDPPAMLNTREPVATPCRAAPPKPSRSPNFLLPPGQPSPMSRTSTPSQSPYADAPTSDAKPARPAAAKGKPAPKKASSTAESEGDASDSADWFPTTASHISSNRKYVPSMQACMYMHIYMCVYIYFLCGNGRV